MSTITTAGKYNAQINSTDSEYPLSQSILNITISESFATVSELLKETNFSLPGVNPNPIIPGSLKINFNLLGLITAGHSVGIRLVSAASTDFNYTIGETNFSATNKAFASSSTPPASDDGTIVWTSAADPLSLASLTVPVQVNYTGTTPNTSITFSAQVLIAAKVGDVYSSIASLGISPEVTITSYSSQVTNQLAAYNADNLTSPRTNFYLNDKFALKSELTTNTEAGYKPAATIEFKQNIINNITLTNMYVSTLTSPANKQDLINDTTTVPIDLTSDTDKSDKGVSIDDVSDPSFNKITLTMPTGSVYDNFFTGTPPTLISPVYVYVFGTIDSIPQT